MDYNKYFEQKGKSVIFIGKSLEIFIPMRYGTTHGYLDIGNTITTIGIFDMTIDGTIETGYLLAATIEIEPNTVEQTTIDGKKFLKLTLVPGDVFIKDVNIVRDSRISYVIFYEMFFSGHYPKFIGYEECAFIFDKMSKATGDVFSTDHMIFEMITSALFREKDNIAVLYRNTDMKDIPMVIPLSMVSSVAQSVTAKLMGSHMSEGLDASLVNAADIPPSDIENLLRK